MRFVCFYHEGCAGDYAGLWALVKFVIIAGCFYEMKSIIDINLYNVYYFCDMLCFYNLSRRHMFVGFA